MEEIGESGKWRYPANDEGDGGYSEDLDRIRDREYPLLKGSFSSQESRQIRIWMDIIYPSNGLYFCYTNLPLLS